MVRHNDSMSLAHKLGRLASSIVFYLSSFRISKLCCWLARLGQRAVWA